MRLYNLSLKANLEYAGCDCDYIAKGETEEEVIRDLLSMV
jgi:hypothetical protein